MLRSSTFVCIGTGLVVSVATALWGWRYLIERGQISPDAVSRVMLLTRLGWFLSFVQVIITMVAFSTAKIGAKEEERRFVLILAFSSLAYVALISWTLIPVEFVLRTG
jgi:hypothetical protein